MPARVREAIGSILRDRIDGAHILDLYAGSGIVSFELLSRGAAASLLVEQDARLARRLEAEARRIGFADRVAVRRQSVATYLAGPCGAPFDIVVADPPYRDAADLVAVFEGVEAGGFLASGGVVVSHRPVHRGRATTLDPPPAWRSLRRRRYGQALFEIFLRPTDDATS